MLSRVTAKNVQDVFFETQCMNQTSDCRTPFNIPTFVCLLQGWRKTGCSEETPPCSSVEVVKWNISSSWYRSVCKGCFAGILLMLMHCYCIKLKSVSNNAIWTSVYRDSACKLIYSVSACEVTDNTVLIFRTVLVMLTQSRHESSPRPKFTDTGWLYVSLKLKF